MEKIVRAAFTEERNMEMPLKDFLNDIMERAQAVGANCITAKIPVMTETGRMFIVLEITMETEKH